MKFNKKNTVAIFIAVMLFALLAIFIPFFCFSQKLENITGGTADAMSIGYIKEEETQDVPEGAVSIKSIGIKGPSELRIVAGGTYNFEYQTNPEEANETVYWKSSNERAVTITQDGKAKILECGESVVTVSSSADNSRNNVVITVIPPKPSILDVPYIWQVVDYPNGCESCSTVMALNYIGIDIDTDEFIDNYLDMCELPHVDENGVYTAYSPWTHFAGDPRNVDGLCCYAPVITNALKKFIDTDKYVVDELHGVSIERLCSDYINHDIPVIFWATMYMEKPYLMDWTWTVTDGKEGETFTWVAPMHCMLLIGYDDDYYYFNDPVAGKSVAYTKKATEEAYNGLYEQAVAVYPVGARQES